MPHDSPATDLPRTTEDSPTTTNTDTPNPDSDPPATRSQDEQTTPSQKRIQAQTKKKFEFIGNLMTNLDVIIYVEICILYYMDCSLFRLLLRVLNQMMFLSPKPNFIPPAPQHRPYIGAIFGPNIICILLHIFTARSEAGEAMRGYLHGGIIVDLIGQKGPTSKIHLVLLDLLVLALQCFMLAVHIEKERLNALTASFASPTNTNANATGTTGQARAAVVSAQDHDAEERGVMRDAVRSNGDIEMQTLPSPAAQIPTTAGPSGVGADEERNPERERLLAEPTPHEDEDDDEFGLDMFWSGTVILADFHILHNLKRQWDDYGNATESAIQTVGFSAEFAAVTANRRINAASASLQRSLTV